MKILGTDIRVDRANKDEGEKPCDNAFIKEVGLQEAVAEKWHIRFSSIEEFESFLNKYIKVILFSNEDFGPSIMIYDDWIE